MQTNYRELEKAVAVNWLYKRSPEAFRLSASMYISKKKVYSISELSELTGFSPVKISNVIDIFDILFKYQNAIAENLVNGIALTRYAKMNITPLIKKFGERNLEDFLKNRKPAQP